MPEGSLDRAPRVPPTHYATTIPTTTVITVQPRAEPPPYEEGDWIGMSVIEARNARGGPPPPYHHQPEFPTVVRVRVTPPRTGELSFWEHSLITSGLGASCISGTGAIISFGLACHGVACMGNGEPLRLAYTIGGGAGCLAGTAISTASACAVAYYMGKREEQGLAIY